MRLDIEELEPTTHLLPFQMPTTKGTTQILCITIYYMICKLVIKQGDSCWGRQNWNAL